MFSFEWLGPFSFVLGIIFSNNNSIIWSKTSQQKEENEQNKLYFNYPGHCPSLYPSHFINSTITTVCQVHHTCDRSKCMVLCFCGPQPVATLLVSQAYLPNQREASTTMTHSRCSVPQTPLEHLHSCKAHIMWGKDKDNLSLFPRTQLSRLPSPVFHTTGPLVLG